MSPLQSLQCCVLILAISTELNELMTEAQLLQVSLPEIQELYEILFTKQSPVSKTEQMSPVGPISEKASIWGLWFFSEKERLLGLNQFYDKTNEIL